MFELEPGVLARVAGTVTPQPVIAVVEHTVCTPGRPRGPPCPRLVVVCVDVRDPGNAGTVVALRLGGRRRRPRVLRRHRRRLEPQAVRSSAGAVLHVPVVAAGPAPEVLTEMGEWGLARLGTASAGGADYADTDLTRPARPGPRQRGRRPRRWPSSGSIWTAWSASPWRPGPNRSTSAWWPPSCVSRLPASAAWPWPHQRRPPSPDRGHRCDGRTGPRPLDQPGHRQGSWRATGGQVQAGGGTTGVHVAGGNNWARSGRNWQAGST